MKTFSLIALIVASTLLSKAQNPSESLFNGKNLDGWKIYGTEK